VAANWTTGTEAATHVAAVQDVLDGGAIPFLHFPQWNPISAIEYYRTEVLPKLR
jgi:hypothetical protein